MARVTIGGMGLVAALSGLLVKALGRIATAAFGWAATLLFGRQPRDREVFVSAITIASLAWVATVVGVAWPDVGLFIVALVPLADLLPADVARLLMLAVAALLPAAVGVALATVGSPAGGLRGRLAAIARGYLVTPLLAVVVVWLAAYGIYRRVRLAMSGWTQVHLPVVIPDGRTDEVAAAAVAALGRAGLDVTSGAPDRAVGLPAAWLARAAGRGDGDAGGIGRAVVLRGPTSRSPSTRSTPRWPAAARRWPAPAPRWRSSSPIRRPTSRRRPRPSDWRTTSAPRGTWIRAAGRPRCAPWTPAWRPSRTRPPTGTCSPGCGSRRARRGSRPS